MATREMTRRSVFATLLGAIGALCGTAQKPAQSVHAQIFTFGFSTRQFRIEGCRCDAGAGEEHLHFFETMDGELAKQIARKLDGNS